MTPVVPHQEGDVCPLFLFLVIYKLLVRYNGWAGDGVLEKEVPVDVEQCLIFVRELDYYLGNDINIPIMSSALFYQTSLSCLALLRTTPTTTTQSNLLVIRSTS